MDLLKLFRRKPKDPFEEGLAKLRAGNGKAPNPPPCGEHEGRKDATTGLRGGVYWHAAAICACIEALRRENRFPPWSVPAEKGTAAPG